LKTEIREVAHQQDAEQKKLVVHLLLRGSSFFIDRKCHPDDETTS